MHTVIPEDETTQGEEFNIIDFLYPHRFEEIPPVDGKRRGEYPDGVFGGHRLDTGLVRVECLRPVRVDVVPRREVEDVRSVWKKKIPIRVKWGRTNC